MEQTASDRSSSFPSCHSEIYRLIISRPHRSYAIINEVTTDLLLNILKISLQQVRFSHRAVQPLVRLGVHIADDAFHDDISGGVSMRVNLDGGVPVLRILLILTFSFVLL